MVARDVAFIISRFYILMLVLNLLNAGVKPILGEFVFLVAVLNISSHFLLVVFIFTTLILFLLSQLNQGQY